MEILTVNSQTFKKLKKNLSQNDYPYYLIYGEHLISEAHKKSLIVEMYTTLDSRFVEDKQVNVVSPGFINDLTKSKSAQEFALLEKKMGEIILSENVLVFDGIQDPGNLGTIIRTMRAYGITQFFFGENTVNPYSLKVQRAIQGVDLNMTFCFGKTLDFLKKYPHTIVTTFVHEDNSKEVVRKPFALCIGNEGNGLSEEIKLSPHVNKKIEIEIESLNVAVASGIIIDRLQKGE